MFDENFQSKLIYIFEIFDENHKGLLKIGDTSVNCDISAKPNCDILNKAAISRIKSITNTAGIGNWALRYTSLAVREVDGKFECFRDYDVHAVLLNSGIKKFYLKGTSAREWFKVDLQTAINAIDAVKHGSKNLSDKTSPISIIFRPEQEEAISLTVKNFKTSNHMLWNAKMRFGKTLCALEVARRMNFAKTIIITHRPAVNANWYEDYTKIFNGNKDYDYNRGYTLEELLMRGKNFVYFASIQDLRGSDKVGGKFEKNSDVFNTDWDFVIVDEAHEGTTTALGNDVIKNLVKPHTKFLALSGTPFNIIADYEENVFTWDYISEQQQKLNWADEHCGDSNPYSELPALKIFTYNLGKLIDNPAYFDVDDKAFNFREFFKTDDEENFVHKADVESFLNLLTKNSPDSNFPFSRADYRKLFQHTLWIIPGIKEGRALSKLLKAHKIFGGFKIVNVAGNGDEDEESADALDKVKYAIDHYEYTITLSCGKLTTGVTVPEWTAVFMLAGSFSTSATSYLQTVFRVQNPCRKDGKFKEYGYVFDFAPDRALKMVAESVAISARAGKTTDEDRLILGELMNYLPIIAVEGSAVKNFDADKLLQQLKGAYASRVVNNGFDDFRLYNDNLLNLTELDLKDFYNLKNIIGAATSKKKTDIVINAQGFDNERYEVKVGRSKKIELTDEQKDFLRRKKIRANAISILRQISIRIPLLIYGADIPVDEDFTIDMLFDEDIVDSVSWAEFMPLGVTKEKFRDFVKYYDKDIFVEAGRRIRTRAKLADELPPVERVKEIAAMFSTFKNPDKETVLTQWRVVNLHLSKTFGGYVFFDENFQNALPEPRFVNRENITSVTFSNFNAKILEINSKTGLYPLYVAYSIYRARIGQVDENKISLDESRRIWDNTIRENIFVICKTPMAMSITRRTLAGFRDAKVNARYFDNLIDTLKNSQENFISEVLAWKGDATLKFDAVVGNPPYQIEGSGDNKTFSAPVYHEFLKAAFKLGKKVSLIHPARFLFNAGATPKDFNREILNDEHLEVVDYFKKSIELFPNTDIKGGIAITYRDENKILGPIGTFTEFPKLNSIMHKVCSRADFKPLSEIMRGQMTYRLSKKAYEDFPDLNERLPNRTDTALRTNAFEIMPDIFLIDKPDDGHEYLKILGKFDNERVYRYVRRDYMEDIPELKFYKVFVPAANGSGAIGEAISTPLVGLPLVGLPLVGCTQTFITVGKFDTRAESEACIAYIKTKFCRAMLGILKITQHNPPSTWAKVPLQNFRADSDINWTQSIAEIDKQLYEKYELSEDEIKFIEKNIKSMA